MDIEPTVQTLIKDLNILIEELDHNPKLSTWAVRLILKSIKDKALQSSLADKRRKSLTSSELLKENFSF